MTKGFFISGTDTNVGKTIVSSILVNKFDAIYYKPIQCGRNAEGEKDSDIVRKICKKRTILNETYFLRNPLSPNIAAKKQGVVIRLNELINLDEIKKRKKIIIEGAGGLQVPINEKYFMTDLIKYYGLPLILVCRTKLGTINHSLLSISLLKKENIQLMGLVFVGKEEKETTKTIQNFGKKIYGKEIKILANNPQLKVINKKVINKMQEVFKSI